jgi:hypothetical protein
MSTPIEPEIDASATEVRPFQFSLRTLLLFVSAVAVLMAIITRVGAVWSVAIVLGLLLVTAHISANAFGTRAVNRTTQRLARRHEDDADELCVTGPLQFAPHSRLSERRRLGWSMPLATVVGAAVGGTFGSVLLSTLYFEAGGFGAVLLGGFSATVLGGFLGFLASTFIGVTGRALSEASRGEGAKR